MAERLTGGVELHALKKSPSEIIFSQIIDQKKGRVRLPNDLFMQLYGEPLLVAE